ncbi:MAG: hypothetical protein M1576_01410 [Deltaproteobacteria bacterium]|nr:hypothetical protein [Deltaproteobacteria bacterium]
MIDNTIFMPCKNFYDEKFKDWQPTPLHRIIPFIYNNEYFENVRKFVKDKGKDCIASEFKHDSRFSIISDIKNEITKDILFSILSDIFGNNPSYDDIIDIIADATIDALL